MPRSRSAVAALPDLLTLLRSLVRIETPTGNVAGLADAAALLRAELPEGATTDLEDLPELGPLLRCVLPGAGTRILLLAHLDTVHPAGSWPRLWEVRGDRAFGPGAYDTKAGAVLAVWALRLLAGDRGRHPTIEMLLTPDEEIGSPRSRPLIEEAARRADACLVLEPAMPDGSLKLARKATAEYRVTITGRAAHQGVWPERGVNAVVEAAHQVLRLVALEDSERGTTVGPNVIRGGVVSNMVAAKAEIAVDVRTWSDDERRRLHAAIRGLAPRLPGAEIAVTGGWNRPAMQPTPASRALFERIRGVGADLGLDLGWVALGGGSDANFTSAAGAPTVDGLGAVGDNDHQPDEHIVVSELPKRLALLTGTLAALAEEPIAEGAPRDTTR